MTSNSGPPPDAAASEAVPPGSVPPADERVRKTSRSIQAARTARTRGDRRSRPRLAVLRDRRVRQQLCELGDHGVDLEPGRTARDSCRSGGAAHDRWRVRPLHRFDSRIRRDDDHGADHPIVGRRFRLGRVARDPRCAHRCPPDRVLQRVAGDCDQTTVVHHHAGDVVHLPWSDDRADSQLHQSHAVGRLRRSIWSGTGRHAVRHRIHGVRGQLPGVDSLVDRNGCARHVDPVAHQVGQLDLRLRVATPTPLETSVFR